MRLSQLSLQPSHMQSAHHPPIINNLPLPSPSSKHLPPMSLVLQSSSVTAHTYASPAISLLQHNASAPRSRSTSSSPHAVYDIAKIHAHNCTIIRGAAYNAAGHIVCAVSNLRDRPCMRVGKCPFHHPQPISSENSTNGVLDATGTSLSSTSSCYAITGQQLSTGPLSLAPPKKRQYKRGWSLEEHYFFLQGLHVFGHGSWKKIEILVKSRDPTQIQSHAQKFQERQRRTIPNTKRSINDLTLDSQEMIEIHGLLKDTELKNRLREIEALERMQEPNCRQSDSMCHTLNEPDVALSAPLCHQDITEVAMETTRGIGKRAASATDMSGMRSGERREYDYTGQVIYDSDVLPYGTHCITSSAGGISHLLNPTRSSSFISRGKHSTALCNSAKGMEHVLISPRTITGTGLQPCVNMINQNHAQPAIDEICDVQFETECPVDENCRRRWQQVQLFADGGRQTEWQEGNASKKQRIGLRDKIRVQNSYRLGFQISAPDVLGNVGEGFFGDEPLQGGYELKDQVVDERLKSKSNFRETEVVTHEFKRHAPLYKGIDIEYRQCSVEF